MTIIEVFGAAAFLLGPFLAYWLAKSAIALVRLEDMTFDQYQRECFVLAHHQDEQRRAEFDAWEFDRPEWRA